MALKVPFRSKILCSVIPRGQDSGSWGLKENITDAESRKHEGLGQGCFVMNPEEKQINKPKQTKPPFSRGTGDSVKHLQPHGPTGLPSPTGRAAAAPSRLTATGFGQLLRIHRTGRRASPISSWKPLQTSSIHSLSSQGNKVSKCAS